MCWTNMDVLWKSYSVHRDILSEKYLIIAFWSVFLFFSISPMDSFVSLSVISNIFWVSPQMIKRLLVETTLFICSLDTLKKAESKQQAQLSLVHKDSYFPLHKHPPNTLW